MEWDEKRVCIQLDKALSDTINLSKTLDGGFAKRSNPSKMPRHVFHNLALGGENGGDIDETALSIRYVTGHIRRYKKQKPRVHASAIKSLSPWADGHGHGIVCGRRRKGMPRPSSEGSPKGRGIILNGTLATCALKSRCQKIVTKKRVSKPHNLRGGKPSCVMFLAFEIHLLVLC